MENNALEVHDVFGAMIENFTTHCFDVIVKKASYDRPGFWVASWKLRDPDAESGEFVDADLATLFAGLVPLALARRMQGKVFVPALGALRESETLASIEALAAFASTKLNVRWLHDEWIVEWESQDESIRVNRAGSIYRKDLGEAVAEAFDRTVAVQLKNAGVKRIIVPLEVEDL